MAKEYEVGDKVIIREDLLIRNRVPFGLTNSMLKLKGKTVTITQRNKAMEPRDEDYFEEYEEDLNGYNILEDNGRYLWHSQMFKKLADPLIETEAKILSLKSRLQNLSLELDKVSCELSNLIEEL